jgi:hypothetical protein
VVAELGGPTIVHRSSGAIDNRRFARPDLLRAGTTGEAAIGRSFCFEARPSPAHSPADRASGRLLPLFHCDALQAVSGHNDAAQHFFQVADIPEAGLDIRRNVA